MFKNNCWRLFNEIPGLLVHTVFVLISLGTPLFALLGLPIHLCKLNNLIPETPIVSAISSKMLSHALRSVCCRMSWSRPSWLPMATLMKKRASGSGSVQAKGRPRPMKTCTALFCTPTTPSGWQSEAGGTKRVPS